MADSGEATAAGGTPRRDFLNLVTASFVGVGVGAIAWPFINSMQPARDVLALASTDAELGSLAVGQAVKVIWRGKPIFVRHRTREGHRGSRAPSRCPSLKRSRQPDSGPRPGRPC
jgi:ubiquinol-cytochrome c reductase iron-sulfur subunit